MSSPRNTRGSEWHKWDLHLHAPGTKLNNQFGDAEDPEIWTEFCRRLYDSDVQAFGIADYFSAEAYLSTVHAYRERYPDSPKVFFPNIELRTSYVVNRSREEVNVHLLFNPFAPDCHARLEYFLGTLSTNRTDSNSRNVKASELRCQDDYEAATTTREFIQRALEETFGKGADLLDCALIVTAANNDGIRPERGIQRKLLITDELDKFSNAFFGNADNAKHFLRTDRLEDKSEPIASKPVLSGCDAHSFNDLKERLGQVVTRGDAGTTHAPTWIKADLTYEGVKQIIFEPANRVFIGEEPEVERRVREDGTRYIESLHVNCVEGYRQEEHGVWFRDEQIPLGKELVAIIGNKGSGKSAVTDIIGLLGNSHNQVTSGLSGTRTEELFSFLNKEKFLKGGCAKNFEGVLNWHAGQPGRAVLDAQVELHVPEKVEYLPQKYLERICANLADDEFRKTLNKVIFQYVRPQDQHGKKSLDDVIRYRTQQAEIDIAQKRQLLSQANAGVATLERKLTDEYAEELREKIRRKREQLDAHAKAKPRPRPNQETNAEEVAAEAANVERLTKRIASLVDQIAEVEAEQIRLTGIVEELRQARQAITRWASALTDLEPTVKDALAEAGVQLDEIVTCAVDYEPLDRAIAQSEQRLGEIGDLLSEERETGVTRGDDEAMASIVADAPGASLVCQKEAAEREKADTVRRLGRPAREQQQYLDELRRWEEKDAELRGDGQRSDGETLRWLEDERQKVATVYVEQRRDACERRNHIAKDVFGKKRALTQFYNEVKQSIDGEIAKCRAHLGEYEISIDAGLRFNPAFFEGFLKFINKSAAGSFRGQEDGQTMLRRLTESVLDWEDERQVFEWLAAIVDALHVDRREDAAPPQAPRNVFKQMKGQQSIQDLYDYLFGFEYLDTKYDLRVDGKDLSELSPGERGGLLLVFYLMLDRQDIPLVIDQPEDNLDNKSVYQVLVTFIKEAKKRRQIILVTHNPNLAVVADAEQIIHVRIDKTRQKNDFDFHSGAIEDPVVNQSVVDILEGTMPAFDNRRLKYRTNTRRA